MKSTASFTWDDLLAATGGSMGSHRRGFDRVTVDTDTRTLAAGSLFIPLAGANFDGHTYIEKAYALNAEGSLVSAVYLAENPDLKRFPNLIIVEDVGLAYLSLARHYRRLLGAKIVAITGSSGKTTTKEMLGALLATVYGENARKSEQNFNNEVGVPQTILSWPEGTVVGIVEMGMRGKGQISVLSRCAEPDISIITNVGPAHIGLLGSMQDIAEAKCEIFQGMDPATGLGIVNGDDALLTSEAGKRWEGRLETFSLHEVDEIHTPAGGTVQFNYESLSFSLGLPGSHNVLNALSCLKACEALGIPLKGLTTTLGAFEAGGGRWTKTQINPAADLWVINDAYNANPASVKVSLAAFLDTPAPGLKKVAVLGGMAELGSFSPMYHAEVGAWLGKRGGLDGLIVLGEEARPLAEAVGDQLPTIVAESAEDAVALIQARWPEKTMIFLKASRAFHLEAVIEALTSRTEADAVS